MAVVTLSEKNPNSFLATSFNPMRDGRKNFLSENRETFQYLCQGANGRPDPIMLASFWDNLADNVGDFFSNITEIGANIPNVYAANYGLLPGQFPQPGQMTVQTQGLGLLNNPAVLIAGAALLFVILNKK